jgi:hypothetical protein
LTHKHTKLKLSQNNIFFFFSNFPDVGDWHCYGV